MKITDNKSVDQIQNEFSALYPGLKIEFYNKSHGAYKASPKTELIDSDSKIGDIRTIHLEATVTFNPTMAVAEVEGILQDKYGLNVQILRRSKEIWLQTSATDDWTLEKQNLKGLHSIDPTLGLYSKP